MADYIIWTLLGITIYLEIGYIFVLLINMYEESIWEQIKVMLFWPFLCIILIIFFIALIFINIYSWIKKKIYD